MAHWSKLIIIPLIKNDTEEKWNFSTHSLVSRDKERKKFETIIRDVTDNFRITAPAKYMKRLFEKNKYKTSVVCQIAYERTSSEGNPFFGQISLFLTIYMCRYKGKYS